MEINPTERKEYIKNTGLMQEKKSMVFLYMIRIL